MAEPENTRKIEIITVNVRLRMRSLLVNMSFYLKVSGKVVAMVGFHNSEQAQPVFGSRKDFESAHRCFDIRLTAVRLCRHSGLVARNSMWCCHCVSLYPETHLEVRNSMWSVQMH